MCSLSGFDSEVEGFSSKAEGKKELPDGSTQTHHYSSASTGSQTSFFATNEVQTFTTSPSEIDSDQQDIAPSYPPGLSAFLKKVVPAMMEALDDNDNELHPSSAIDSPAICAELLQTIDYPSGQPLNVAAGDQKTKGVLCLSWSNGGNSLAISYGETYHEDWCEHGGLIKIFTIMKTEESQLKHVQDIEEHNCVTALQYHPDVAALLAYGTAAGEVTVKSVRSISRDNSEPTLKCDQYHSSMRVSYLMWADAELTSKLLWLAMTGTTKRRGASDLVLISSGFDGSIIVWQVNPNLDIMEKITGYLINGSQMSKELIPDISCFDFNHNDCFIVGSKTGHLISCRTSVAVTVETSDLFDPAVQKFDAPNFAILKVAFKNINPYIFVALSSNSQIGLYKLNQSTPLKVFCMDGVATSMEWVPKSPNLLLVGIANDFVDSKVLNIFDMVRERNVTLEGVVAPQDDLKVTAVAINRVLNDRVAVGLAKGNAAIYKIPFARFGVSKMEGFELYCN